MPIRHRSRYASLVAVAGLLLVSGCGEGSGEADAGPDASADAACARPLELGWGRREGGAFVPYRDGEAGKVTLGFQGFRFIDGVARLSGTEAKAATFRLQVTVEGQPPSSQELGKIDLLPGPDGALYAEPLQLFFNDVPLPEIVGRPATVIVRATVAPCTAQQTVRLTLERGGCQSEDGGTECPDAGR